MAKKIEVVEEKKTTTKETANYLKNLINKSAKKIIVQMFDDDDDLTIPRFSSGVLSLDMILGKGSSGYGFPIGRTVEIYGPSGSGKSSLVLSAISEVQRSGGLVALIDSEHCLNLEYAARLGIKIDELLLIQPSNAEEGYDAAISLADSGEVALIVIDSIAAMVPKAISESTMEQNTMGVAARMNGKFINNITPILNHNNTSLLAVNQIRNTIGGYGNPVTTPGGEALKFAYDIRVEVRRGELLSDNGEPIGHIVKAKIVKNKTAVPLKTTEFRLDYGIGFNKSYCLITQGLLRGVFKQAGAWLYFEENKWQGRDSLIEELENNALLLEAVTRKILEA